MSVDTGGKGWLGVVRYKKDIRGQHKRALIGVEQQQRWVKGYIQGGMGRLASACAFVDPRSDAGVPGTKTRGCGQGSATERHEEGLACGSHLPGNMECIVGQCCWGAHREGHGRAGVPEISRQSNRAK